MAPNVTGLLAAALLVASKVLKPDEAVQGFGSPALITLMGLFARSGPARFQRPRRPRHLAG